MPQANQAAVEFLAARKSVPLSQFTGPGPDEGQLMQLLTIAARAPDHGRLEPWRFIVYRDADGAIIGEQLAALSARLRPNTPADELERDRNRLRRAPVAIGVVSNPKEHERIPQWEQFLSAGAVAMNLVSAATAMGFAANWVTGWYSDDAEARAILGLRSHERMAGVVHLGHCERDIPERPRPDVEALVSAYAGPVAP
ncbi:MAG: nitroreductase [Ahrensia sp.]